MEGDSVEEQGASFEFDCCIDVNQLIGNHSTPVSTNQVPANFSHELGELSSSCGSSQSNPKHKLTAFTNGISSPAENYDKNLTLVPQTHNQLIENENPPSGAANENVISGLSNNPSVVDDPNLPELNLGPPAYCPPSHPHFPTNPPLVSNPLLPYPPPTVQMVHPFPSEQHVNWMNYPNQFNARAQSGFQPELFPPRPVAAVNQNFTFSGDQHGQFIPNNNMISSDFRQAPAYPPFPQTQMWKGERAPPWMNQQQPWLSLHNNVPLPPSGPHHLPNHLQHHNQVPGMANVLDPHEYHNFMPPGSSFHHSYQHFPYQLNRVPNVPPNAYDPQSCDIMLPNPSLSLRPPEFQPPSPFHQHHPLPTRPDVLHISPQYYNSMTSMLPWNQQLFNGHLQYNQVAPVPPTLVDPSEIGLSLSTSSTSRQFNQNGGRRTSNSNVETSSQQIQLLNSESNNKETRCNNYSEVTLSLQLDSRPISSSSKGKEILGRRSMFELGESSSSSKRPRVERTQENDRPQRADWNLNYQHKDGNSNVKDLSHLCILPARNAIYDPLYEGIGLPIDPHLRMLSLI